MRGYAAPWAVAGGWAIDLALGAVSRAHADVDLAAFRDDQRLLRAHLAEWRWEYVDDGVLVPWHDNQWLALPVHELYATNDAGSRIELLLNERDGHDWVFRRDPRVRLPLARAIVTSSSGLPALAPEVVLLYKSKEPRATDEADFGTALPRLDPFARRWLHDALGQCYEKHPWQAALHG
jgi:Aminoglycoside-2''-adenylyltransferase